jgi:hypothetical protein
MCKGQTVEHLLLLLKSLDFKNVAENIGLFRLPREDVMYVQPGVSSEMFQWYDKGVWCCIVCK